MEWLRELLGDELYEQVTKALGDTKILQDDGNWVSRQQFEEVNKQKNEYKKMLGERDKQLKELKDTAKGSEELSRRIKELEEDNKKSAKEYESKIQEQAFNFALENSLRDKKAKNVKAVKALLDLNEVKQDGETLLGLDTQLEKLRESDPYLFEETIPAGTGGSKGNKGKGNQNVNSGKTAAEQRNQVQTVAVDPWSMGDQR